MLDRRVFMALLAAVGLAPKGWALPAKTGLPRERPAPKPRDPHPCLTALDRAWEEWLQQSGTWSNADARLNPTRILCSQAFRDAYVQEMWEWYGGQHHDCPQAPYKGAPHYRGVPLEVQAIGGIGIGHWGNAPLHDQFWLEGAPAQTHTSGYLQMKMDWSADWTEGGHGTVVFSE